MNARTATTMLLAIIMLGATSTGTMALPDDYVVTYNMYDDPTDPDSNVVFSLELSLTAVSAITCQSGPCGSVAYEVESIEFTQPQNGGNRVWVEESPVLDTLDGYWWVYHADLNAREVSEFDMPPYADGTAIAQDPLDVDLDYWFEGKTFFGTPPFENTVGLVFQMVEEPTEEPVAETPPDDPEPLSGDGSVHDPS